MTGYPRGFLPAVMVILAFACASGALLAPTTLALRADVSVPWRLAATHRLLVAAAHAAAGFAALAVAGALWSVHMRSGWRRRQQRGSGAALALLLVLLAVTALGVYYAADDRWSAAAAFVHVALGLLMVLLLAWHWSAGRRLKARGLHHTQASRGRPSVHRALASDALRDTAH